MASPRVADFWEDHFADLSNTSYASRSLQTEQSNVHVCPEPFGFDADRSTILLYHFDEGRGYTAVDFGPSSLDGRLNNMDASVWVEGLNGTALDFDGVDHNVQTEVTSVFNVDRVTVEAWVYQRTAQQYGDKYVVAKRSGFYLMDHGFIIDTPTVVPARNIQHILNEWVYLAGSYDGSTVRFFRNGALAASAGSGAGMKHDTDFLQIAAWGGDAPFYVFNGIIDEVRVSNISRTPQEINDTFATYLGSKAGRLPIVSSLVTGSIFVPPGNYWGTLDVKKSCPAGTSITLTVLDCRTGMPLPGFADLAGQSVDLAGVSPVQHPSLKLEVAFRTDGTSTPLLDRLGVSWRPNIPPRILNISAPPVVVRGSNAAVTVAVDDSDQPASGLEIRLQCRYGNETPWEGAFFGAPSYTGNGSWTTGFAPDTRACLGPYQIRVVVTDELGTNASGMLDGTILVLDKNDATVDICPMGTAVYRCDNLRLAVSAVLDRMPRDTVFQVEFADSGREPCEWAQAPSFEGGRWWLTVAPPAGAMIGPYSAHVRATAGGCLTAEAQLEDVFIVKNNPPRANCSRPFVLTEDVPVTFSLSGFLADRDTSVSELGIGLLEVSDPGKADISTNGRKLEVLDMLPDWYGRLSVKLYVTDSMDRTNFSVQIVVEPVEDAPRVEAILDVCGLEDTILQYTFNATDPDPGDVLRYFLDLGAMDFRAGGPALYTFDPRTGRLAFPLTNEMVGSHQCNLTISDGTLATISPFILNVSNVNDPPFWEELPGDATVVAGAAWSFDADATDVDAGDIVVYSVLPSPASGVSIDPATGVIRWSTSQVGTYVLDLCATDGQTAISHRFNITVRINSAPRIVGYSPGGRSIGVAPGAVRNFHVEATDADGDPLEYTWYVDGQPAGKCHGFKFNATTTGRRVLRVEVSDGWANASHQWDTSTARGVSVDNGINVRLVPMAAAAALACMVAVFHLVRRRKKASGGQTL